MSDVSISIDQKEVAKVLKNFKKYGVKAEKDANISVLETAFLIESDAKRNTPVQTNRLRSSIHVQQKDDTVYRYTDKKGKSYNGTLRIDLKKDEVAVGSNVEYAPFIEFGTKHMSAQPYLFPAFRKNMKKLVIKLKAKLSKLK
jgi:HK97 gp10 family phage protein